MYDRGPGPPLVVVPGVQGRWEWMMPALEALARKCRTISYTLRGDFGSGRVRCATTHFDGYLSQLDAVLDQARVPRTALCGVSYGGFIALRYAATRPERVSALILVSAPAPGWRPSERQARYIAHPLLSTPVFVLASPFRMWPEIRSAIPAWGARVRFLITHGLRVLLAPIIPPLMARRVRQQQELDFGPDCAAIRVPTLIVTGDEELDSVVPVAATRRFEALIPAARHEKMSGTGHIGMITQPDRFAEIVSEFVHASDR